MSQGFLRTVGIENLKEETGHNLAGISLFTGAGGFDLGFAKAGLETRVMVEWDKHCCNTLRANWTEAELLKRFGSRDKFPDWYTRDPVIIQKDIKEVTTKEILDSGGFKIGEPMFVIGGPPCQGFSIIGQRVIDDPKNALYREFVRVVREALPKFFVFENVPGLASMGKGEVIKQICDDFAACGYQINWKVLNAADYGVPQNRRRIFIIGKRNDVMVFRENERVELHLGGSVGPIKHPEKFIKKYCKGERWQKITCTPGLIKRETS